MKNCARRGGIALRVGEEEWPCTSRSWSGLTGQRAQMSRSIRAIGLPRLTGARLHVVHAHKVATETGGELGVPVIDIMEVNEAIHTEGQRICDQAIAAC